MISKCIRILLIFLCASQAYTSNIEPMLVNAVITAKSITFKPASIPENIPFVLHIINKSGVPVELENADTSVEIFAGTDKTFKIGLSAGNYKFFNDFNPKAGTKNLHVLSAAETVKHISYTTTIGSTNNANDTQSTASSVNSSLGEIVFIIWRECIEALLVVGIVYSWLKHLKTGRKEGMVFLAAGVGVGVLCAVMLGAMLIKLSGVMSGNTREYLQASLTFLAALMIVYMVKWMRNNGTKLKSSMINSIAAKHEARRWNISILIVVAVAIAREGSEAVIFIYALGFGEHGVVSGKMFGMVVLGIGLAIFTIWLLSLGNKIFSWKHFFKITEVLLLLLGGALLLNCVDLLVSVGILPVIKAKFWDTSFILGDGGHLVPLLSSLIGYRATPSLVDVLVYIVYWIIVLKFIKTEQLIKKIT